MTDKQLRSLDRGDIIRNDGSGESYVVLINLGQHVIAVREVDVTNAPEWTIAFKHPNEDRPIRRRKSKS